MGQRWNEFSDYGSSSSTDSSTTWCKPEMWARPDLHEVINNNKQKSSSYADLMMGRCTLDDVMQEFKMNGTDSPYVPDEDHPQPQRRQDDLAGLGPAGAYLRQKSWPEPERTPAMRLPPRPSATWLEGDNAAASGPMVVPATSSPVPTTPEGVTTEQLRVLLSLPDAVLYPLLRDLEQTRAQEERKGKKHTQECRFCKNNGERESYYRSHSLKDAAGRVRCPVLRAFVCRRCGARGDHAHTIKYCPLSTDEERFKSAAMMRSVRQASGRRRAPAAECADFVMFGDAPPSLHHSARAYATTAPLDPLWAALEQKLML